MRLIDADILAYALYDESPAHSYAFNLLERGLRGEILLHVTPTTILEAYNALYWFYRVRPVRQLLEKLKLAVDGIRIVETSIDGIALASAEEIPLGDGFLIASALRHKIPVLVSNDKHIASKAPKRGLIVENPIPSEVRDKMAEWSP